MNGTFRVRIARRSALLLAMLLLLSTLFACHTNERTVDTPTDNPTQQAEVSPAPEPTPAPEPSPTPDDGTPYKGDGSAYVYRMTSARDRGWEEDIVYLADTLLNPSSGHPKLTERGCSISYLKGLKDGYEEIEYAFDSLYDEELHTEFLRRINELLLSIGEKSDEELLFGCAEAVAILNDGHTSIEPLILTASSRVFPLGLIPIYTDGVMQAYIVAAPDGKEDLLLCRLDAVNGIPIAEIIDDFGRIFSHENRYFVEYNALEYASIYLDSLLLNCSFLRYYGIIGNESSAVFTVTDETGASRDVKLSSVGLMDYPRMSVYYPSTEADEAIAYWKGSSGDVWSEMLDDGKVIYVCIRSCSNASDEKVRAALEEAKRSGTVEKVILDFRRNGGGNLVTKGEISKALEAIDAPGGKYVLIDGGSFSAAVIIPVCLRRFCTDVVLVGQPAGMPPNGAFGSGGELSSPNRHIVGAFAVRDRYYAWPGIDDPALMPDIVVYQTLEDYKAGVDSVMKYLLRGSDE